MPEVRRNRVDLVEPDADGYQLTLDSGETLRARRVVIASGLEGYAAFLSRSASCRRSWSPTPTTSRTPRGSGIKGSS